MRLISTAGLLVLIFATYTGCANSGEALRAALKQGDISKALQVYESQTPPDPTVLEQIAMSVLERAALENDPVHRDAAITQLKLAGTRGQEVFKRLSEQSVSIVVQAQALEVLAALGDENAAARLHDLFDSDDAEVKAAAISALDPVQELERIMQALDSPAAALRLSAARLLRRAAPQPAVRLKLSKVAHVDPAIPVRIQAITSLSAFGKEAWPTLEPMLSDEKSKIRTTCIAALVRLDYGRATEVLGEYLQSGPSVEGIVLSQWLISEARAGQSDTEKAFAYLYRTLSSSDATLRNRAAVTLDALPSNRVDTDRLLTRIQQEDVDTVRLSLIMVLIPRREVRARLLPALRDLMNEQGMVGVQAAVQLALQGDRKGIEVLIESLSNKSSRVRQTAARALARDLRRPHTIRHLLVDKDPLVHIAASGAVLSAIASATEKS